MASSKSAVYAAIVGNFAIAVTKFAAASISGSSAMMAEGIHSLVDTGNGGLILLGLRRSKRPPDASHPFGYGKSLYFYTLIVAILIFGVGGGISIYEGILHILHPGDLQEVTYTMLGLSFSGQALNYTVLGLAILFEGAAWTTAYRSFTREREGKPLWTAIRESKDPSTFTVLFEDTAALAGLIVAFLGIYFGHVLEMPVLDGIASVTIGVILCGVASLLVFESKGLLVGESAAPEVTASIERIVEEDPDIEAVVRVMTMQMGPQTIILNLDLMFDSSLSAQAIERAIDRLEHVIRTEHEQVKYIFIEVESLTRHQQEEQA